MGIKETQRRVTIIMDKDDYEKVSSAAKKDRRSVSSYCNNVIMLNIESAIPQTSEVVVVGKATKKPMKSYRIKRNVVRTPHNFDNPTEIN